MAGDSRTEGEQLYRGRRETEMERLDRNWNSLLQELRVVQTGVQVLTGFSPHPSPPPPTPPPLPPLPPLPPHPPLHGWQLVVRGCGTN